MKLRPSSKSVLVTQGAYSVSADPETVLTSILGSCVATCLFDPIARLGGMNHFLLPGEDASVLHGKKYGRELTLNLISDLERRGAVRGRLQAKLFGGGQMFAAMINIGELNADFAEAFLSREGIAIVTKSTGGERARRVRFWPASGRAQQMFLEPINQQFPDGVPSR